jgi:hypothetical protein
MFTRSTQQITQVQKAINRLDSRAEELKKKWGAYNPLYREYERVFQKVGGSKNTTVGKFGNLRLKRGKTFIDQMSDKDIEELLKLESKNLTAYHIEQEKKKDDPDFNIEDWFKDASYHEWIMDHLGAIYRSSTWNSFIHERRKKSYGELDAMIKSITGKELSIFDA